MNTEKINIYLPANEKFEVYYESELFKIINHEEHDKLFRFMNNYEMCLKTYLKQYEHINLSYYYLDIKEMINILNWLILIKRQFVEHKGKKGFPIKDLILKLVQLMTNNDKEKMHFIDRCVWIPIVRYKKIWKKKIDKKWLEHGDVDIFLEAVDYVMTKTIDDFKTTINHYLADKEEPK